MGQSQRDTEKRRRKAGLERGSDERESLLQPGETRLVRRAIETARPRSKNDTVVRLAGDRRQSELQKSGVTFAGQIENWRGTRCRAPFFGYYTTLRHPERSRGIPR